jgi:hypothetical protein
MVFLLFLTFLCRGFILILACLALGLLYFLDIAAADLCVDHVGKFDAEAHVAISDTIPRGKFDLRGLRHANEDIQYI